MANRVTPEELAPIVPDVSASSLAPYISTANLIVDEEIVGKGLSDARLKEIEKYLAAHFATITNGELTMRKIGDSQDSYAKGLAGKGLKETAFGRQACLLDTSGTLASQGADTGTFDLLT
jgi:hypothetical protein